MATELEHAIFRKNFLMASGCKEASSYFVTRTDRNLTELTFMEDSMVILIQLLFICWSRCVAREHIKSMLEILIGHNISICQNISMNIATKFAKI